MPPATALPDSYYQRTGERRYKPTAHAGGAWHTAEQHFSPLAGLVVHAIDRHRAAGPADRLALARISYDILGRIADLSNLHLPLLVNAVATVVVSLLFVGLARETLPRRQPTDHGT